MMNIDMSIIPLIIVTIFVACLVIKIPVAFCMAFSAIVCTFLMGMDYRIVPQLWTNALKSYTISAIPFFVLAGNIMNTGGITKRIFNFAKVLVGHIAGGLGHVVILACMIFSGISGSFTADAAGIGTIAKKAMDDQGYEREFGAAIVCAASILGPIIPPSILFVYYAAITGVSVSDLFMAGMIPGILAGILLMVCCFLFVKSGKVKAPTYERASRHEVWVAFKDSILAILAPVIIIGGMLTGWVTPTEAAILACMYSILVSVIYKDMSWKDMPKILLGSAITSANAQFLVSAASMIGWVVTYTQVPKLLSGFITGFTSNVAVVLLLINIYLLIQGCFIDTTSGEILITPILFPIAQMFGINTLQFGIIICYNLILGALTPPMGAGLYLVSSVTDTKVEKLIPRLLPFFAVHIVMLTLITYIPAITTWLPTFIASLK